jgi:serine/threonine protein kinase
MDTLLVGKVMAGYRIDDLIGRGGLGVVYLAWDTRRDRRVAVKVLAPYLTGDEIVR